MANTLLAMSRFFARLPARVCRHRWLLLVVIGALSALMAWTVATRLSMDMSLDSFLDQQDPAMRALNEFRSQFGSDDSVFLVYEAADGDVFSEQSLSAVHALTESLRNVAALDPANLPARLNGVRVDLGELNTIRRVQSLTTLRVQRVDGDTLRSERLIPWPLPESTAELAELRIQALAEEDYRLAFFSPDGRFGAVMIQTNLGAQPVDDYVSAVDQVDMDISDSFDFDFEYSPDVVVDEIPYQTVDMFEYAAFFTALRAVYGEYDEYLHFFPVGNPPLMDWIYGVMQQVLWLALGMIVIFASLLWLLFRSASAIVWPMLIVSLSLLWTLGLATLMGMTFSTLITLTFLLTFAVGIADCVHVMSAYFTQRRNGDDHVTALSEAYDKTGLAILVTTLTTMCGVLALTLSNLIPLRVFGYTAAMGVAFAFVFTVIVLPILLSFWHPDPDPEQKRPRDVRSALRYGRRPLIIAAIAILILTPLLGVAIALYVGLAIAAATAVRAFQDRILLACPRLVARNPMGVVAVFAGILLVSLYGMTQVRVDSNIAELARQGTEPQVAYSVVDEHMAGAQNVSIMIDTGVSDGILEPAMLNAIDALQSRIEQRYPDQISRTFSLSNIVRETHRVMNHDDPAYDNVPDDRMLVSQLLYLFNSSNPEERRAIVSDDYSRSHITINAYNAGSYQYQALFQDLHDEIDEAFAHLQSSFPELNIEVTGSIPLMMRAMDEIAQSQYNSFLLALAVISVIMMLTLGSVQAGLLAMIPNLIPALLTFGLLGLLGQSLDLDTLMIAPVIIGIAVDDTIHFMTHYRVELLRTRNMQQALLSTVQRVGKAVMFTTMILGMGFAILIFSDYLGMAKIGFFGTLAIVVALLCDLFLLPAMIMIFKPRFGIKNVDSSFELQGIRSA